MVTPKPNGGETKDKYLDRVMKDSAMVEEYPDEDQRAAVGHASFISEDAGKVVSAIFRKGARTYSLDAELFSVGKWNGYEFTLRDLEEIVDAFNKLKDNHKVPLKFGHNDTQPMTDGQPALGWVESVKLDRSSSPVKMVGHFTDVPEIVYNAMKKKLYRKVSVELDFDVEYKGTKYGAVLSGVALLGADLPAVNVLADLEAYMTRNGNTDSSGVRFSRRLHFTYDPLKGGRNMDELQKAQKENAELRAEVGALKAENSLLKADKETFTRREKEREENDKRNKLAAKRSEINNWCEEQVKAGTMLPAQRDLFKQAVGYDQDDRLLATDIEPLKKMFSVKLAAANGGSDHGGGQGTGNGEGTEQATAKVMKLARERSIQTKETFENATYAVLQADPALAKAYHEEMNKEVK